MAVNAIILFQIQFKNFSTGVVTPVRLTTAAHDVEYPSGTTWVAAGDLLSVGELESTYELITEGIEVNMSGINSAYQSIIDQNGFRNAPVDVWLASLSESSNIVNSAIYYHRGFSGNPVTDIDETSGTISVSFETESAFKSLDRNSQLMSNSIAHHQSLHTGDMFYQYVADSGLGEEVWRDG